MAKTRFLVLPMRIDTALASRTRWVLGPTADFSTLPWRDDQPGDTGWREEERRSVSLDRFGDIAPISENFVSQPFAGKSFGLLPGVHLHWALPSGLTKGRHPGNGSGFDTGAALQFPAIPNRWLVERKGGGLAKSRWVVESDYVWPVDTGVEQASVVFPLSHPKPGEQPFRLIGRVQKLSRGQGFVEDPHATYLHQIEAPLTAMGWGDPQFHAFYPNCHSVLGFYDAEGAMATDELTYTVNGWYSSDTLEPARLKLEGERNQTQFEDRLDIRLSQSDWTGLLAQGNTARLLCTGEVHVTQNQAKGHDRESASCTLAVANSSGEAISTYLAAKTAPAAKRAGAEHGFEALRHHDSYAHRTSDHHAKLDEARHTASFTALDGGTVWSTRVARQPHRKPNGRGATASKLTPGQERDLLAAEKELARVLSSKLHALNTWQQALEHGDHVIAGLSHQLYADWCKYMACAYRPAEATRSSDYPPLDALRRMLRADILWLDLVRVYVGRGPSGGVRPDLVAALEPLITTRLRALGLPLAAAEAKDFSASFPDFVERFLSPDPKLKTRAADRIVMQALARFVLPRQHDMGDSGDKDVNGASILVLRDRAKDVVSEALDVSCPVPDPDAQDLIATMWQGLDHQPDATLDPLTAKAMSERLEKHELIEVPAARYWRPNEPTVLLHGEDVLPSDRYQPDQPHLAFTSSYETSGQSAPRLSAKRIKAPAAKKGSDVALALKLKAGGALSDTEKSKLTTAYCAAVGLDPVPPQPVPYFDAADTGQPIRDWATGLADAVQATRALEKRAPKPSAWHPMALDWQVGMRSLSPDTSAQPGSDWYDPGFLEVNFDLHERDSSLSAATLDATCPHEHMQSSGSNALDTREDIFAGRSLLTPYPAKAAAHQAAKVKARAPQTAAKSAGDVHAHLGDGAANAQKPPIQVQALSGFNDALAMHRLTLQLPIQDPLGFAEDQSFAKDEVRPAVGSFGLTGAEPWFGFRPIRSGRMALQRLRLIDTFGRTRELDLSGGTDLFQAHALRRLNVQLGDDHKVVGLPPRLVQPARVDFRWLAAEALDNARLGEEVQADPVSTPVCGWLVPNLLDGSIETFDSQGEALGAIDPIGRWRPAPGRAQPRMANDVENPHLRRVLIWALDRCTQAEGRALDALDDKVGPGDRARTVTEARRATMGTILDVLESALENIEPESFAQHEAMALIMGRPIAVARASVSLDLAGRPIGSQSWDDLHRRLNGAFPTTENFENVRIPIRIGEHMQLDDSVVGYWLEEGRGSAAQFRDAQLFAPQSTYRDARAAQTGITIYRENGAGKPLVFERSLTDAPQVVTMLLDPRGAAHCTTGLLPTTSLRIPAHHVGPALQRIQVSFRAAPVLSHRDRISVPLPAEPGQDWSWIERRAEGWLRVPRHPILERARLLKALPKDGAHVWDVLHQIGWLAPPVHHDRTEHPQNWADVILPRPAKPGLPAELKPKEATILGVLETMEHELTDAGESPRFGTEIELREGWLELGPGTAPKAEQEEQP